MRRQGPIVNFEKKIQQKYAAQFELGPIVSEAAVVHAATIVVGTNTYYAPKTVLVPLSALAGITKPSVRDPESFRALAIQTLNRRACDTSTPYELICREVKKQA